MLLLLLAFPAPRTYAEDETKTPRQLLNEASVLQAVKGDMRGALRIYESILARKDFADLAPDIRAEALLGAAGCHEDADDIKAATVHWEAIQADDTLPDKARTVASERLQAQAATAGAPGVPPEETERRLREQVLAEEADKRMRRAQKLVEEARAALGAARYKEALSLCLQALSFDQTNQEALRLQRKIEAAQPDLGQIFSQLVQFFQAQELAEYERVRQKVREKAANGRAAYNQKDWIEADRNLRDAIRLIDESGFLTLGGAIDTTSLDAVRTDLVVWLRANREKAEAAGIRVEPEPPLPDIEARRGGLQQQFFSVAAQIFTPREESDAPLSFYKFAPAYKPAAAAKRELDRIFFDGLKATHKRGTLTRAHWAERWIRRHIGTRWVDPRETGTRGRSRTGNRRILLRLGDLICAQSRGPEHARIEKLRRSFAKTPPPMFVDVRVFAVSGAGAVASAEALRVRASARGSGLDHVVQGRLVTELATALEGLPGVVPLGRARVSLDGETSVLLELTRLTSEHPAYLKLPAPPLSVPDEHARYGLWLDLYAEDMPAGAERAPDRSAIDLHARVTQPADTVSSHVIPRTSGPEQPYTRLPLLTEVERAANRTVPHYGALVMQGLPNPFPGTRVEHGELIVLIGTTRRDTPIPDPPRAKPSPRILPDDSRTKDYPLGSISITAQDDIFPEDWPQLRNASDGLSSGDRQELRDLYLAGLLMQMANLDPDAPGGRDALQVQDHRATATLTADDHLRLGRAVVRLQARENDLYRASVLSAVVDRALWRRWTQLPGVEPATPNGNHLAAGEGLGIIEKELGEFAQAPGLFNMKRSVLLRSTQQKALSRLNVESITKALRVRLLTRGRQRYTAEPGVAEEGLLLEIRPGLEMQDANRGFRTIRVRARAARLNRIEQRPYPGATQEAALFDVPIWHTGTNGAYSERRDAEILSDDAALLLPVSMPGAEEKVILVLVRLQRMQ